MVQRNSIILICIVGLSFLLFSPQILLANPSVDVPVRHWSYDAIEKLAILGLADIADIGFRPVSRIKMAYIIQSAIDKTGSVDLEFEWDEQEYIETLLDNLIEEFRDELVAIGVSVASIDDNGPKINIFKSPELNIDKAYASIDPNIKLNKVLFENRDGWKMEDGFNLRLKLTSWAKLANLFAINLTPGVRYSNSDTDVDFENAHIRFSHSDYNMELSVGRSAMWWGPGFYGSLLMTDNSFPLDTVRFNNVYPFRLPWILQGLGRFNAQFLVSRLEEKSPVPHTYLTAWRADYTPCNFMKFGFGHIMMHGGKGVKKLGFSNYWSSASLVFSAAGGGTETENHIISGDTQFFIRRIDKFIPLATGAKLYAEVGAEDEAGNKPIDLAYIYGAYLTDVFTVPGFDGKLEISKFDNIWYTHFRYTSGYTHRGSFIGHRSGGDSESIAVTGVYDLPDMYSMSVTLSHERRGLTRANIETKRELRIIFSAIDVLGMYNIENVDIDIFYDFEDTDNFENTLSKVKNHIIGVEIKREF